MKILKILSALLMIALLLSLAAPVFAAPAANPGKGPPNIEKTVFVHYPKGAPAKGGIPGAPDGQKDKEKDSKLWYKYGGVHWADGSIPVNYKVNLASSGDDGSFLDGIQAAFQAWEDEAESYIEFNYVGGFQGIPSSFDGDGFMNGANEVGWTTITDFPRAIAVTSIWRDIFTLEIVEVDVAMNIDLPWSQTILSPAQDPDKVTASTGAYDVQNIMTHEAGHWLMLEDMYQKPAGVQTMYGYSTKDELKKRSLESGDEAGVQEIYTGATKP